MDPIELAELEIRRLKQLNRHLRNEIRVLHQRLRDANRGAERKMHVAKGMVERANELSAELQRLKQRSEWMPEIFTVGKSDGKELVMLNGRVIYECDDADKARDTATAVREAFAFLRSRP